MAANGPDLLAWLAFLLIVFNLKIFGNTMYVGDFGIGMCFHRCFLAGYERMPYLNRHIVDVGFISVWVDLPR